MSVSIASSSPADQAETPTFEGAMERLETLVEQMENARLPLEDLIRCYEEGTRLVKTCTDQLAAAEQRIELIARDAAGQARAVAFDPAAAAAAPAPDSPKTRTNPPKAAVAPPAPSSARDHEVSLF